MPASRYNPAEPRVLADLVEDYRRAHAVAGTLPPGVGVDWRDDEEPDDEGY